MGVWLRGIHGAWHRGRDRTRGERHHQYRQVRARNPEAVPTVPEGSTPPHYLSSAEISVGPHTRAIAPNTPQTKPKLVLMLMLMLMHPPPNSNPTHHWCSTRLRRTTMRMLRTTPTTAFRPPRWCSDRSDPL